MIEMGNDGLYPTKNTALAAYLRTEGFTLLEVAPATKDSPAVFYFEQSKEIVKYEKLWQLAKATGNLFMFWESYRLCLRMVRVGKL